MLDKKQMAKLFNSQSLFGVGLISEIVMRKIKNINYKTVLLGAILITLLLICAELAVGILGTPFSGN